MLISETVDIRISNSNKKHFENIGYKNIKKDDIIKVKVNELTKGSHVIVECKCDYCGELLTMKYKTYYTMINQTVQKIACRKCNGKKVRESNMTNFGVPCPTCLNSVREKVKKTTKEHYGVEYISQCSEIKEKVKQTCLEKYGVVHVSKLPEHKEKLKKTCLRKYGVESVLQVPEVRQKIQNTIFEKYGVNNPSQSEEIKQKKRETTLCHYGVEYGVQSPVVRERMNQSYYKNQSLSTSYQQEYICRLYRMTLNYPIKNYNADMCDIDNKIICEYDGGGHNLKVKLGIISEEEFNQKEIIRNNIIKREGYKVFRIISSKDKLPNDSILLKMLEEVKKYFKKYPSHSWIEFDIDNSCIRNAEYKNGIPYNFGEIKTFYK